MTKFKHQRLLAILLLFSGPPVSGNVMIDGCDSGVPDSGGIQAGVDTCVANAGNHGKLVSCVTHYTKSLERQGTITKSDRKAIKGCAAHSDIGKGNNAAEDD